MKSFSTVALALAGIVIAGTGQAQTPTDLGTLGGSMSYATAVNDSGIVVGSSTAADGSLHAFARLQAPLPPLGVNCDLGTLLGGSSQAAAVNNAGLVVGVSDGHAFAVSTSACPGLPVMTDLLPLSGGSHSEATAVNDAGMVVGWSVLGDGTIHATSWSSPTFVPVDLTLGSPFGGDSYATAVNASGTVVGYAYLTSDDVTYHAFAYSGGPMIDLKPLTPFDSGGYSYASAVNSAGVVVGFSSYPRHDQAFHAVSWSLPAPAAFDLGVVSGGGDPKDRSSAANAVNDFGKVVGYSFVNGDRFHAFSRQATGSGPMVDLLALDKDSSSEATAVSNSVLGQVVGYSYTKDNKTFDAVWWRPSGIVDLGTLGCGTYSLASAVNSSGLAVGYSGDLAGPQTPHAVQWDLGTLVVVPSVNGDLTVVSNTTLGPGARITGHVIVSGAGVTLTLNGGRIGQDVQLQHGGSLVMTDSQIDGSLQVMDGGSLMMTTSCVGHDVQINKSGPFSIAGGAIGGNVQIQNLSGGASSVCGASINGNLQADHSGAPLEIGGPPLCAGNTIGHDMQIQNGTAPIIVSGNMIGHDVQINNNTQVDVTSNTGINNLQCNHNTMITGGANTASNKQQQCSGF